MNELTLGEKTYLSECIDRVSPELKEKSYELAGNFTRPQRARFLALTFKHNYEEAKEMLDNIIAFQTK